MSLQFEINIFKDLIGKYPIWEDLQKYLESNEGGLFKITEIDENGFCLIRYEKEITKMDLVHSKWFRSVVWNTKENKPVCMAPSKAATQEFPFNERKELSDVGIVCQELLEGFMINCFKVASSETLYITSRSKLNATGKFYSDKSFRELFIESYANTCGVTFDNDATIHNSSHFSSPDISNNEVATFFSFLVQHKEHRIVKPIDNNYVYLIHSGVVYDDGRVSVIDSPDFVRNIENISIESNNYKCSYASQLDDESNEVQKWIRNEMADKDWTFQGLVFKDKDGNRWRFRSEKHSVVKTIRGNSPNIIERFAQLYTQNLIEKYLEYYAEDTIPITIHMMFMNVIIKILYDKYVDLHITKTIKADEVDKMFLPHLYSIHGIYLTQLKLNNKKINFDEIKMYLHKQPWQRLVFLMKKIINQANTA